MPKSYLQKIISSDSKEFINKHLNTSKTEIILKYSAKSELPIKEIAEQIESFNKAKIKLPNLSNYDLVYQKLSLEQCSSEYTANYKSSILKGQRIIDLTGGLGVDSVYFSKVFDEVIYCELDSERSEIAKYNFEKLGIKNIKVINKDSIEELSNYSDNYFDWIFADPSRRDKNIRSVDIKFYSPNILENMELLLSKSKNILLKLAPAFDLKEAVRIFPNLIEFSILSFQNECKEVLVFISKDRKDKIKSAVALNTEFNHVCIKDRIENTHTAKIEYPRTGNYFYEPDAAIRKVGLTEKIAAEMNLCKINVLSDYLHSSYYLENFPGRRFLIKSVNLFNEKLIKRHLKDNQIFKANISRSNFPFKAEEIKNKFNLSDGGEHYLFFTKDLNKKLIFLSTIKVD